MVSRRSSLAVAVAAPLLVSSTAVITAPGATATAPVVARGVLRSVAAGAPYTVSIGAEKVLANGDVTVHSVAAATTSDGTFTLSGPLSVPATKNPDGSIPLTVQVTGQGVTKIFDLNAFAPDSSHPTWRWTKTPDVDVVQGRTEAVSGQALSKVSLNMAGAASAPAVSTTTEQPAKTPTVTQAMRTDTSSSTAATSNSMNCNTAAWGTRYPAQYEKRWIPVQRFTLKTNAKQDYVWTTSNGTQMQVAYAGSNKVWKGGFAYSAERGTETGFHAPVTTSYWSGYVRTRWRFVLQDQYCASTQWPYEAVKSGVHRWYPRNWDGSSLPLKDTATWHCRAGSSAVTKYTSWVAKSTTSRMSGQFSIGGVTLDAMQTNSDNAKHTFIPRNGHRYWMCGNTDDPPRSKLVKEYLK